MCTIMHTVYQKYTLQHSRNTSKPIEEKHSENNLLEALIFFYGYPSLKAPDIYMTFLFKVMMLFMSFRMKKSALQEIFVKLSQETFI